MSAALIRLDQVTVTFAGQDVLDNIELSVEPGQIVSGLFMLFEQPFRMGDWLDTAAARGRVVEVNWRAVHIESSTGVQITPTRCWPARPSPT